MRLVIEALDQTGGAFSNVISQAQQVGQAVTKAVSGGGGSTDGASFDPFAGIRQTVSMTRSELETFYNDTAKQFNKTLGTDIPNASEVATNDLAKVYERMNDVNVAVEKTNNELSIMQKMLAFQSLAQVGDALKNTGEQMLSFINEGIQRSAAAEVIGVNLSNALKINLDPSIIRDGAVSTELLGNQLDRLARHAEEVGLATMFSDTQILGVMEHLASNGIKAETIMNGGAKSVAYLAQATKSDLAPAVETVTSIMHSMSKTLAASFENEEEALNSVADVLTNIKLTTGASLDTIGQSMKYVGPIADEFGMKFQDIGTAVDILYRSGIQGSMTGTALRRMLTNLTPASEQAAEVFAELGLITEDGANKFFDAAGQMKPLDEVQRLLHDSMKDLNDEQKVFAVKTMFGQYALQSMMKIVSTTPEEFDEMSQKVNQTGTAMAMGAEMMETFAGKNDMMVEHIGIAKKKLGDSIRDNVKPLLDFVAHLAERFANLDPEVHKFIATGIAVIGSLAVVIGSVLATVAAVGLFTTGLAAAGFTLGGIVASIGLVVAAVAGIAAVVYLAYEAWTRNFGGIRDFTIAIWDYVKPYIVDAVEAVRETIGAAVQKIVEWWEYMYPSFEKVAEKVIKILSYFSDTFKSIFHTIVDVVKLAWDMVVGIISGAWEFLTGLLQLFVHLFTGEWDKLWDDVLQILGGAGKLIESLVGGLRDIIRSIFAGITEIAKNFAKNFITMLVDGIKEGYQNFKEAVSGIANIIKKWLGFSSPTEEGPGRDADKWMPNMMRMLADGIKNSDSTVQERIKETITHIAEQYIALPSRMKEWATNAMSMFADGIRSKIQSIKDAAASAANAVKDFLGFQSPTRLGPGATADDWMPNLMSMLADGVDANRSVLRGAVAKVAMDLDVGLRNPTDGYGVVGGARNQTVNITINYHGSGGRNDANDLAQAVRREIGLVTS